MIILSNWTKSFATITPCLYLPGHRVEPTSPNIMSLRSHLDRYCSNRAMALEPISQPTRSRSPSARPTTTASTSPFHRPPGWHPPEHRPHRPVIFVFDLKPMQQLAATNSYFNILAPPVAGHLSTSAYDGLFQTSKVIYPGYADSFCVYDLQTVVVDTFLQRWSIHLQKRDFYLSIDTDQGIVPIHDGTPDLPNYTLLDFLNWFYPTWKTHQHLNAFTARPQKSLTITPHPDSQDIAFTVHVRVTPGGHPFFSTS